MANLTRARDELFRRLPDECFESLTDLWQHCQREKEQSTDVWKPPQDLCTRPVATSRLLLAYGEESGAVYEMNDWSFSQLCKLSGVSKDTVNRLTSDTAARVFGEMLPHEGNKPFQLYTRGDRPRSIHGASYTRLFNADLLTVLREFATDFEAPPKGVGGGTGMYCGEQDMFCFLIDPAGWAEIDGQAFAPGSYTWNSEVGRRSLGIQTFWFQAVCRNHVIWDAANVSAYYLLFDSSAARFFTRKTQILRAMLRFSVSVSSGLLDSRSVGRGAGSRGVFGGDRVLRRLPTLPSGRAPF